MGVKIVWLRTAVIFDYDCDGFSLHPAIHLLNLPPGSRGRREQPIKTFRPSKYVRCFRPQLSSQLHCLCHHPSYPLHRRGGGGTAAAAAEGAGSAAAGEAALRLMLERREAELREAMKLRHSLTTLLHALRVDMEQVRCGAHLQITF